MYAFTRINFTLLFGTKSVKSNYHLETIAFLVCIMTSATSESLLNSCDNYILIDVGANIINKKFSRDVDSVIQRAKDAGMFDF